MYRYTLLAKDVYSFDVIEAFKNTLSSYYGYTDIAAELKLKIYLVNWFFEHCKQASLTLSRLQPLSNGCVPRILYKSILAIG